MNFLSPAIQLDIRSEAVTIDIAPTSRYGEQYDIARIQTAIVLAQPLAQPQRFLLPKSDTVSEPKFVLPNGDTFVFNDVIDAGAIDGLKNQIVQQIQQYIANVTEEGAKQAQQMILQLLGAQLQSTVQEIPAGVSFLKFSYTKKIPLGQDNLYTLESLIPLASFTIPSSGQVRLHATVTMPYDPAAANPIAQFQRPDETVTPLSPQNLEGRTVFAVQWTQDPMLTVKYSY